VYINLFCLYRFGEEWRVIASFMKSWKVIHYIIPSYQRIATIFNKYWYIFVTIRYVMRSSVADVTFNILFRPFAHLLIYIFVLCFDV